MQLEWNLSVQCAYLVLEKQQMWYLIAIMGASDKIWASPPT